MATTKLKLYNGALAVISGERELASLAENREPRRKLDLAWDDGFVDGCLEVGQWYFAMRSVRVTYDPSIAPDWGYRFVFEVPDDHIRTCAVCSDEDFNTPLIQVRAEAGFWYATIQTIYVRYVSNDAAFGNDLSLWPESFTEFAKADLASKIVLGITSDKKKIEMVFSIRDKLLKQAKSLAAMADTTAFPAQGSWSRSRGGERGGWPDRGNRGSLIG